MCHSHFVRLVSEDPKHVDLALRGADNALLLVPLRMRAELYVFKGHAIFPLLDAALVMLQGIQFVGSCVVWCLPLFLTRPSAPAEAISSRGAKLDMVRRRCSARAPPLTPRPAAQANNQVGRRNVEAHAPGAGHAVGAAQGNCVCARQAGSAVDSSWQMKPHLFFFGGQRLPSQTGAGVTLDDHTVAQPASRARGHEREATICIGEMR